MVYQSMNNAEKMGYNYDQTHKAGSNSQEDSESGELSLYQGLTNVHELSVNLGLAIIDFNASPSIKNLEKKCNDLIDGLRDLYKTSDETNLEVPFEVISCFDQGQSPDSYMATFMEQAVSENQFCKGRLDTLASFADLLEEEIKCNFDEF
ncbi:hypothetical protein K502DRAFT_353062 [Neoconidiobolus thromboides FSU 785]|nr:hypothetical protein K502DRAFT_353062 [Neoconidiobolus thromboides FSU 785]